jgi:hypothetical protein
VTNNVNWTPKIPSLSLFGVKDRQIRRRFFAVSSKIERIQSVCARANAQDEDHHLIFLQLTRPKAVLVRSSIWISLRQLVVDQVTDNLPNISTESGKAKCGCVVAQTRNSTARASVSSGLRSKLAMR